jgi:hypothetical protein
MHENILHDTPGRAWLCTSMKSKERSKSAFTGKNLKDAAAGYGGTSL